MKRAGVARMAHDYFHRRMRSVTLARVAKRANKRLEPAPEAYGAQPREVDGTKVPQEATGLKAQFRLLPALSFQKKNENENENSPRGLR